MCDHVACGGTFSDVEWSADGSRFVFVSSSRDHKRAQVRIADAGHGRGARPVRRRSWRTFFESHANWRYLSESDEILWYSQRDDWGHLYLYDADTGALKRQVTSGAWQVENVLAVDEDAREILFMGNGREPGDPYFRYLYRAHLDGGEVDLLTPDSAHHVVWLAPDGETFVDQHSTPVTPPVTVVRDMDGDVVQTVERADISRLERTGWQPPIPFTVKARDGETDLYGLMFRPSNFDPDAKYPVINYLYPGAAERERGEPKLPPPRTATCSRWRNSGFVVIELDAMGTPGRSKTFQDAYYGNMGDNGLPDQIAGIRQLAKRHPWIDIRPRRDLRPLRRRLRLDLRHPALPGLLQGRRVAGGEPRQPQLRGRLGREVPGSAAGVHRRHDELRQPGEPTRGREPQRASSSSPTGTMDTNVPHSNTMLVVDALIAANKDFDLLLFPNRGHGFGNEPYMMRRRWDYFVRHLLGADPPPEYEFGRLQPLVP